MTIDTLANMFPKVKTTHRTHCRSVPNKLPIKNGTLVTPLLAYDEILQKESRVRRGPPTSFCAIEHSLVAHAKFFSMWG